MRNINHTKVFISAATGSQATDEIAQAHQELGVTLDSLVHVASTVEVAGRFNGAAEPSWCVFLNYGSILEGLDACVAVAAAFTRRP
jgi:hypothetical protein